MSETLILVLDNGEKWSASSSCLGYAEAQAKNHGLHIIEILNNPPKPVGWGFTPGPFRERDNESTLKFQEKIGGWGG